MALWRDIAGYDGLYQVSSDGRVKSLPHFVNNGRGCYQTKEKILKPGKRVRNKCIYKFVVLSNGKNIERFSVHRLVAQAFLENPNGFDEINHKDKNTENNRVENLEWCDHAYNVNYSKAKKVLQFDFDGTLLATYSSIVVAAQMTGISRTAINNSLCGWSKSAGGYIWKYETEE